MGIEIRRRVDELGDTLSLAPERHDPRRRLSAGLKPRLDELVALCSDSASRRALGRARSVLVLDTSNAYEGFVVLRHRPIPIDDLGSSKRRVQPGDVVVSRLRPYLRQVAYLDPGLFQLLPEGNPVVVSSEFFVLRDSTNFPAAALVPFLLSPAVQTILAAGQEGGHHPRFPRELLASLPIPQALVAAAPDLASQVRQLSANLRQAMVGGQQLVTEVAGRLDD